MAQNIPLHRLKTRASTGVEIKHFRSDRMPKDASTLGAHRDDHYLFFVLESGSARVLLDFNEVHFQENMLTYILPGQVHHYLNSGVLSGWSIAVDASLVPTPCRDVFEGQLITQQPITLNAEQIDEVNRLLNLLQSRFNSNKDDAFNLPITYALLHAFINIVANAYSKPNTRGVRAPRAAEMARQFKALLTANVVAHKRASAYAEMMNVTEGYLNEVLKRITGFSITNLITNEVMLEAKRLLYYSQLNVKQIAHQLGYQDHTYFSRLFKKAEGITPLEFRHKHLK